MKKQTARGKAKKEAKKDLLKEDKEFYMKVWGSRPHICNFCKCSLGSEALTYHFDHILEKEVYPEYRHEIQNIQLLCLPCHNNKTGGFVPEWFKDFVQNIKVELGEPWKGKRNLKDL